VYGFVQESVKKVMKKGGYSLNTYSASIRRKQGKQNNRDSDKHALYKEFPGGLPIKMIFLKELPPFSNWQISF
jgi:hypothetical protein